MTIKKNSIKFDFGEVKVYNKNTLIIIYKSHTTIDVDILEQVNKARLQLLGDIPHNFIVDGSKEFIDMDHEAKMAHANGNYHKGLRLHDAVVIQGMGPKLEAALYNSGLNPIAKTKFFDTLDKAKKWIDEVCKDETE